jgi:hypothetical protein
MKPHYVRIKNPRQNIGRGGGKCYVVHGGGFNTRFLKALAKNAGRNILGAFKSLAPKIKEIAPSVVRNVAPQLITAAASLAGERAAKKGLPDSFVNYGAELAQKGAQRVSQYNLEAEKKQPLSKTQKLVSDFVSDKSSDLLGSLLMKATQGNGVRNLGKGVKNFGQGFDESVARRIGQ